MTVEHLEILVEELSMEVFLEGLLPQLLQREITFAIYPFQGKDDMLRKLPARLQAYAKWLPQTYCILVIADRDDDDCQVLKQRLEQIALGAGLRTRTTSSTADWQVVNRLAIEELDAWYFGAWDAVRQAYPRVSARMPRNQKYRDPDAVAGGAWEAFETILQRAGYFRGGLRKIEVARTLGPLIDPDRNRSKSFQVFRDVIFEIVHYPDG